MQFTITYPSLELISSAEATSSEHPAMNAAKPFLQSAILTAFHHSPAGMACELVRIYEEEKLWQATTNIRTGWLASEGLFIPLSSLERLRSFVAPEFRKFLQGFEEQLAGMNVEGMINILHAINKHVDFSVLRNPIQHESSPAMDLVKRVFEFGPWMMDLGIVANAKLIDRLRVLRDNPPEQTA